MKKIAVFCGSNIGVNTIYREKAKELGAYFANNNISLVYGGGKIGIMGIIADEIMHLKGEVIGVIPHLLKHKEITHNGISEIIFTKTMSERKVKISKLVNAYIALPGGFGTLDEIFEALVLGKLGIESKPIGILNTNGFFNPLIEQLNIMVKEGYLTQKDKDILQISDNVEDLICMMKHYSAPPITKITDTLVK